MAETAMTAAAGLDESELSSATEPEEVLGPNQVIARSTDGTNFYLFNHQAGGHKAFLRSADGAVCKPAIALELQFYEALDSHFPQLRPFVPQFLGMVTVELNLPSPPTEPSMSASSSTAPIPPVAPISTDSTPKKKKKTRKRRLVKSAPSCSLAAAMSAAGYSAKLWKKEHARKKSRDNGTLTRSNSGNLRDYLVLGDLTRDFHRPCVLDIKMGTRQHGEDAPPAKVKSHSAKCAATTSLALGLRLCGMQIYDEHENGYSIWDKSWGRQLTPNDIEPALETYLTSGSTLRWDALDGLLAKVEELKRVVASTTGLRCWGSSLLLVYEGDLHHAPPRQDLRLIDFAHCQMSSSLETPDEGLLLGLTNIGLYLSNIAARRPMPTAAADSAPATLPRVM